MFNSVLPNIIISVVLVHCTKGLSINPEQSEPQSENLDDDGRVRLTWNIDQDSEIITFEIEAETLGYVGFGISPTGSMTGADIFIAGVYENGSSYHSDNHASGFTNPILDNHADWTLHEASEDKANNKTYLKFSRLLDTCDDDDYPIGADTNRLIWALGASDTVEYHTSERRGGKSVNLLGAKMPEVDLTKMTQWTMTLDMEMPVEDTSYWCSFHRGPQLNTKHHIVAFEEYLPDAAALEHTHHFILYNCYNPLSNSSLEEYLGRYTVGNGYLGHQCYRPYDEADNTTWLSIFCSEYLYVWAKGGKKMTFPENIGYPIGTGEHADTFYMLEIHYDNPNEKKVKFETGLKFYYTNETRDIDAGLLVIGTDSSPAITIPPNTTDFVTVGHCGSFCTSDRLPTKGINVFNSMLHSHLTGRKLKMRQFRNNTELKWLDYDQHYDFNYQQNKHLNEEIIILPGDHLTFECTYDTFWKKGKVVIGGLSTSDEMCQGFLWYYPKMANLDVCGSSYNFEQGVKDLGITNWKFLEVIGNDKIWINEPLSLQGDYEDSLSTKFNWTEDFKLELKEKRRFSKHDGICMSRTDDPEKRPEFLVGYPEIVKPYELEDKCKAGGAGAALFSKSLFILVAFYFCMQYKFKNMP